MTVIYVLWIWLFLIFETQYLFMFEDFVKLHKIQFVRHTLLQTRSERNAYRVIAWWII